jgi:hypothetical protein
VSDFTAQTFCKSCGAHKGRTPFGYYIDAHDRNPCRKCGLFGGESFVCRRVNVGRWWWPRFKWVDRDGNVLGAGCDSDPVDDATGQGRR